MEPASDSISEKINDGLEELYDDCGCRLCHYHAFGFRSGNNTVEGLIGELEKEGLSRLGDIMGYELRGITRKYNKMRETLGTLPDILYNNLDGHKGQAKRIAMQHCGEALEYDPLARDKPPGWMISKLESYDPLSDED